MTTTEKTKWQAYVDSQPESWIPLLVTPLTWTYGDDDSKAYAVVDGERVPMNQFLAYNFEKMGIKTRQDA